MTVCLSKQSREHHSAWLNTGTISVVCLHHVESHQPVNVTEALRQYTKFQVGTQERPIVGFCQVEKLRVFDYTIIRHGLRNS